MKYFGFRDWKTHQHYGKRRPPWVKLYNNIIEPGNVVYSMPDEMVGQYAKLLALACKMDNCIPFIPELVAEEIHSSSPVDLNSFAKLGLLEITEGREQLAIQEQERLTLASKDASKGASKNADIREQSQSQKTETKTQYDKEPVSSLGNIDPPPSEKLPAIIAENLPEKIQARIPYQKIISHLNEKAGTRFRHTSKATRAMIKARWKEGHTLQDFITVIDGRVKAWATDPKMQEYLRPSTLFRPSKFENYLNGRQPAAPGTSSRTSGNMAVAQAAIDRIDAENTQFPDTYSLTEAEVCQ